MYDTIIIGRDLSSLIAALASSRNGLKTVLITEGNQEVEHCEAGYAFPIDTVPLSGFGEDQTVLHLLKELQLEPNEAPRPFLMDPAIQVTFSSHRIDLFHDQEKLIIDMIREFPQYERDIRRFYHTVDKAGALIEFLVGKKRAGQRNIHTKILPVLLRLPSIVAGCFSMVIYGMSNAMTFRRVIEAQLAILSHLYTDGAPYPLSAAYLLSLPRRGIYYPLGGRIAWMHWLCKRFVDAGGVLMDNCSVMRIDTKPDINIDIEKAGASATLCGKRLIVSAQWEKLKSLLLQQKIFRRLVHKLNALRPIAYPFCLHLGIRAGGLPEQLAPYAVWVRDETKPLTDQNLVYIQTSRSDEKDRAPEGRRALCATVYLKNSPTMLTDLELSGVAKGIIDSLEGLLPFLRESIDYVNIEKSISLARRSQEIVNQKYRTRKRIMIGINTLSPITPLPNVFLTGGILRAGLGFEGEILAGMDAAFLAGREIMKNEL
jgi:phytoene dehydrogenase-like protein